MGSYCLLLYLQRKPSLLWSWEINSWNSNWNQNWTRNWFYSPLTTLLTHNKRLHMVGVIMCQTGWLASCFYLSHWNVNFHHAWGNRLLKVCFPKLVMWYWAANQQVRNHRMTISVIKKWASWQPAIIWRCGINCRLTRAVKTILYAPF